MALRLRVEGARRDASLGAVVYLLRVEAEGFSVVLEKRYSQFLELHRVMKLRYHSQHLEKLPSFPGQKVLKHMFGGLSQEDIEDRRSQLELYMRKLENNANSRESHYFLEFLQLPKTVAVAWLRYRQSLSAASPPSDLSNQC
jgi:hypothetical protein